MLVAPGKMVTDHFEAPATPLLNFWIRGQSVSLLGLCYCLTELPSDKAAVIGTVCSAAVGVLYPLLERECSPTVGAGPVDLMP